MLQLCIGTKIELRQILIVVTGKRRQLSVMPKIYAAYIIVVAGKINKSRKVLDPLN